MHGVGHIDTGTNARAKTTNEGGYPKYSPRAEKFVQR